MKKTITLLLLLVFVSSFSYGQSKIEKTKFGLQFNPIVSANEFPFERRIRTSWIARALVRFGMSEYLNGEIGGGYGLYTGNDNDFDYYKTMIIPVDFRLSLRLTTAETYPYLFIGVGGLYYDVENLPTSVSPDLDIKDNGIAGFAPAGLGVQIKLSQSVSMDLNAGIAVTTTDNLNYYREGKAPDSYYFAALGFLFGGGPTDDDMDGLMSDKEEELGTDPNNADTDNDGLNDGEEVMQYTTDPLNKDTDGDGLTDGDEVKKYKTDPQKPDTDGDGLNDREEVLDYKTNPLMKDTDGDSLTDSDEVKKYKTDPLSKDTDKDTLSDGDEVNKYKTSPIKMDTDGDGLRDNDEVMNYKTNPNNKDTDQGSIDDGTEVKRGTDPLNADDDIVKIGVAVVLEGINFATGSADITPESSSILQGALKTLKNNPDIIVEISGHTDAVGSAASNKKLSQRRADAVRLWLINNGIEDSRLNAVGYGEDRPIAPNDSPENRLKNRRIEFVRTK